MKALSRMILGGLLFVGSLGFAEVYQAKYLELPDGSSEMISLGWVNGNPSASRGEVTIQRYPQEIIEHSQLEAKFIVEISSSSRKKVEDFLSRQGLSLRTERIRGNDGASDELIPLVENGPSSNRIDLVIMGDGYTVAEREKFIADAKRIVDDMFNGVTFHSYLPLFNVYAVFRPSKESGIGKNDTPKDTAYGLYRLGNTLRAIFVDNKEAARESCEKAPGCDYPILMGNDPYYGGLGGEFAITTSSPSSGTVVLRHELGHNFGRVGEEYDGGNLLQYFGQNSSKNPAALKWSHHLKGVWQNQHSIPRFVGYPWHNLSGGKYTAKFYSNGLWSAFEIVLSVSGMETNNDISVKLDGVPLVLESPGTSDRFFQTYRSTAGFSAGHHELTFSQKVEDGNNWVSNLTVHEFASNYVFDNTKIGAYPTFSETRALLSYRPTHNSCLMRNMTSDHFCPVCQENNWHNFFSKVSLIDEVMVTKKAPVVCIRLQMPELGQFRKGDKVAGEQVTISWYRDSKLQAEWANKREFELPLEEATGNWEVRARFVTPEVIVDPSGLLEAKKRFSVSK